MYTLVTGATGFIGKRLVRQLAAEKRKIKCLVRENSDISELKQFNVEFVYGDVTDYASIEQALADVDTIYHLAAKANPSNYKPYRDYEMNVSGTVNILKAAAKKKTIRKVLCMSSIAATGPSRDQKLLTEESPYLPITNYGISKVNVEKAVKKYGVEFGVPCVVIRPPMVYGIGDKDWVGFFKMIEDAGQKNKKLFVPGNHKNLFDFCYVDNLVKGMIQAEKSEKTVGKTYFLSDEKSYRIEEILKAVSDGWNVPCPTKFYSIGFMKMLAALFDGLGKVFHFDGPVSRRDVSWMTTNYWVVSCQKAKDEFGYHPDISLEEGIRRTIDWYQKQEVR